MLACMQSMSCKPCRNAGCTVVDAAAGMHTSAARAGTCIHVCTLLLLTLCYWQQVQARMNAHAACMHAPACHVPSVSHSNNAAFPHCLCLYLLPATARYKQLWQSLGFHSIISARPPMSSIMVPAAGQLLAAKFTHRLLQTAQQRPNAPILVHLFSGGGFIFMGWVFQILSELEPHNAAAADVRSRIRGVIFDSSPADVTAGAAHAVASDGAQCIHSM